MPSRPGDGNHRDARAGGGRQESDWAPGSDYLPRRAHGLGGGIEQLEPQRRMLAPMSPSRVASSASGNTCRMPKFDRRTMVNDLTILFLDKKVTGVTPRKVGPKGLIRQCDDRPCRRVRVDAPRRHGLSVREARRRRADCVAVVRRHGERRDGRGLLRLSSKQGIDRREAMLHFDTCKGDSGGPLYVQNPNGDWLPAGATSRGTAISSTMCGDGGTYVRVDAYAEWVKSVLDEGKPAAPRKASAKTKAKAELKAATKSKAKAEDQQASRSRRPRPRRKAKAGEVSSAAA